MRLGRENLAQEPRAEPGRAEIFPALTLERCVSFIVPFVTKASFIPSFTVS